MLATLKAVNKNYNKGYIINVLGIKSYPSFLSLVHQKLCGSFQIIFLVKFSDNAHAL